MGKTLCRQNFVWVVFSMFLASALPMVQAQVLPDAAHEAGFTAVKDKRIGPFAVKNLAGSVLASGDMDDRPVLYHIWSPINDPSGLGPSVAAELARELPGTDIVVLSTATTSRLSALATQMTLDKHRTAANARDAIRALGNPPAPAWVFVAAGDCRPRRQPGPQKPYSRPGNPLRKLHHNSNREGQSKQCQSHRRRSLQQNSHQHRRLG